jgi:hypothetical protein
MKESQIEPHISVSVQQSDNTGSPGLIDMLIENTGQGPAYDLNFIIHPDFDLKTNKLSEIGFIQNGIRYFGINQNIKFFLTSLYENFEQKAANPFEIEVSYHGASGKQYNEKYTIDFSQFSGMAQVGEPPINKLAKSIEKIEKNIDGLTSGFKKLYVITQTKTEYKDEKMERLNSSRRDD